VAEEDVTVRSPGPSVKQTVEEGPTRLRQERHDAVATVLGARQVDFAGAPSNVAEFEASNLSVAHPGGDDEHEQRPIALADRVGAFERIDYTAHLIPRQIVWDLRQRPDRYPRHVP
jgi:hypothetical protein